MIKLDEIEGPEWADRSFEISIDGRKLMILGTHVMSLIPKTLYIGAGEIEKLTTSDLRACRRQFAHAMASWRVEALIDHDNLVAQRFAKFFGLELSHKYPLHHLYVGEF